MTSRDFWGRPASEPLALPPGRRVVEFEEALVEMALRGGAYLTLEVSEAFDRALFGDVGNPTPLGIVGPLGLEASAHVCGDGCVCPIHGTPLLYAPNGGDHACQDPECEHAHGGVIPGAVWPPIGLEVER